MTNIYLLRAHDTHEPRYVGKTRKSIEQRFIEHVKCASAKRTHRDKWINSLDVPPRIELICEVPDQLGNAAEVFWIAYLRALGCRLTNHTSGGDGGAPHCIPHSPESRALISARTKEVLATSETRERLMNRPAPTLETRAQIAATLRGRSPSHETRVKISAALKSREFSPEHRANLSAALIGNKRGLGKKRTFTPEHCAAISAGRRHKQSVA